MKIYQTLFDLWNIFRTLYHQNPIYSHPYIWRIQDILEEEIEELEGNKG